MFNLVVEDTSTQSIQLLYSHAESLAVKYQYHHGTKLYRKISRASLLPSVLLQVHITSNNTNGNKRAMFFWYRRMMNIVILQNGLQLTVDNWKYGMHGMVCISQCVMFIVMLILYILP